MAGFKVGKKFGFLVSFLVLIFVVILASASQLPKVCNEIYRHDKTISTEKHDLKVELADSPKELDEGLSGRKCIGESQAMLFVFDRPGYYNFWMKEMKFPIDIVWIDSTKKIIEVTDNIQPSTYPDSFTSNQPPQYVLEVQAGRAAELGLSAGKALNF